MKTNEIHKNKKTDTDIKEVEERNLHRIIALLSKFYPREDTIP